MGRIKAKQLSLGLLSADDRKELRRLWYHFGMNHQAKRSSLPAFVNLLCAQPWHIHDVNLQARVERMSHVDIRAMVARLGW
jgi:hypothetical protein